MIPNFDTIGSTIGHTVFWCPETYKLLHKNLYIRDYHKFVNSRLSNGMNAPNLWWYTVDLETININTFFTYILLTKECLLKQIISLILRGFSSV